MNDMVLMPFIFRCLITIKVIIKSYLVLLQLRVWLHKFESHSATATIGI